MSPSGKTKQQTLNGIIMILLYLDIVLMRNGLEISKERYELPKTNSRLAHIAYKKKRTNEPVFRKE